MITAKTKIDSAINRLLLELNIDILNPRFRPSKFEDRNLLISLNIMYNTLYWEIKTK